MHVRHQWIPLAASSAALALGVLFAGTTAAKAATTSVSTCDAGSTFVKSATDQLSNGLMTMGWCSDGNDVRRVNQQYQKTSGPGVSLRFGFQRVNSDSSAGSAIIWDNGAFSATSGHTYYFTWHYSNNELSLSPYPCVRGVLKDQISGVSYHTKAACM